MGFLLFPWLKDKISIQDKREWQARPVGQRRRDVEAAVDQPVADHGKPVTGPTADRLHEIVLVP